MAAYMLSFLEKIVKSGDYSCEICADMDCDIAPGYILHSTILGHL